MISPHETGICSPIQCVPGIGKPGSGKKGMSLQPGRLNVNASLCMTPERPQPSWSSISSSVKQRYDCRFAGYRLNEISSHIFSSRPSVNDVNYYSSLQPPLWGIQYHLIPASILSRRVVYVSPEASHECWSCYWLLTTKLWLLLPPNRAAVDKHFPLGGIPHCDVKTRPHLQL